MHACVRVLARERACTRAPASVHAGVCARACERACRVCLWALLSLASVWAGDVPELHPIECTRSNLRLWQILSVKNYSVLCPLTLPLVSLQPLPVIPSTGDPATQHRDLSVILSDPPGARERANVRACDCVGGCVGNRAGERVSVQVCAGSSLWHRPLLCPHDKQCIPPPAALPWALRCYDPPHGMSSPSTTTGRTSHRGRQIPSGSKGFRTAPSWIQSN